jgi:hypothetical protein
MSAFVFTLTPTFIIVSLVTYLYICIYIGNHFMDFIHLFDRKEIKHSLNYHKENIKYQRLIAERIKTQLDTIQARYSRLSANILTYEETVARAEKQGKKRIDCEKHRAPLDLSMSIKLLFTR